ncbi:MAG: ornithine carbamoyltransferase [Actinomycetales bacterium]|nr:ornithine carbamoyltransferase [Actinomycetales bacterium]
MVRHFLKDDDINSAEQAEIIRRAIALKKAPYSERPFAGPKTVALIFDKTSTRTRVSFSVGVSDLGGAPLIIDSQTSQMGGKESVADTARVLTRQVAQIVWRTYSQAGLEEMAAHSSVPVVNSLSDDYHPCQILADLMTVQEHKHRLAGLNFAYVGDAANNMANSYLIGCALAGMHVRVAAPAGYEPDLAIVQRASAIAATTGGSVEVFGEPAAAIRGADVVATDTWISMGQEAEKAKRIQDFAGFTIDSDLMSTAAADAIFLHCLPAYRGYEVTADVIDGPQSVIWDEAENRLHAQKALMVWLDEQSKISQHS